MTSLAKERAFSWAIVVALGGVLAVLAILQYRWIGEVSQAEDARMQASLQYSLREFRQDLTRELAKICLEIQPDSSGGQQPDANAYAQQFAQWHQTASHPALVEAIYVWDALGPQARLLRLNATAEKFEPVAWPANFTRLKNHLQAVPSDLRQLPPTLKLPLFGVPPSPAHRFGEPPHLPLKFSRFWAIDQNIPALVHPVLRRASTQGIAIPVAMTWIIVQLNNELLQHHILSELAQRHFGEPGGLIYEVAVIGGAGDKGNVIYSSDPGFAAKTDAGVDGGMNLWGPPINGPGGPPLGLEPFRPQLATRSQGLSTPSRGQHGSAFSEPIRLEPIHYTAEERNWEVVVKHRKGSLEAAVAALRRRNLAVSFGILLVLAATSGLIIFTSQRARRLAQLQMDFVAGVSHELRTPLAVISSAAENIVDGVVDDQQQLSRYGSAIRQQAKQLAHLVEQVLLFAQTRRDRPHYNVRPLRIGDVIDAALESTADVVNRSEIRVERKVDGNLPLVKADFAALSQCLQNLITNAVKYSGTSRWIGISAIANGSGSRGEAQISVEDKGLGIAEHDLERIFEPFYRGRIAVDGQIHGTGLGLPLAKSIAEALGGRLTVRSEEGKGTSFTVHLPVAQKTQLAKDMAVNASADPTFTS